MVAAVLSGLCLVCSSAAGWAAAISRVDLNVINPASFAFDGASYTRTVDIAFNTASGAFNTTINVAPLATNIHAYGIGGIVVSPTTVPDGTTSFVVTGNSPGGTGKGFGFGISDVATTTPGLTSLTVSHAAGVNQLSWSGPGTGIIVNGGTYISEVEILGDWSDPASHSVATYAAGYTLLSNFVFNGTYTLVEAQTTNYQGVGPQLAFTLQTVPEPASCLTLITALGIAARRRRIA